jgi:hypothetical protein
MKYSTLTSRYPFTREVVVLDLMDTDPLGRWVRSMTTVSDVGGKRGERESSMAIGSRFFNSEFSKRICVHGRR